MSPMNKAGERRLSRVAARAKANCAYDYRVRYRSAAMGSAPRGPRPVEEKRRSGRHKPDGADVCLRRIGGFNFSVRLRDLSASGCGIELIEPYDVDDQVIARFRKLDPLGARVRWTSGSVAGIEFNRAIHPAVFENLLGRLIAT